MTAERFKYLLQEKWKSYNGEIKMPEYHDLKSNTVINIIDEEVEKICKLIHDTITDVYDEFALTEEQRAHFDKKWKFSFITSDEGQCLIEFNIQD